jgi:hypothetical protein
MNAVEIEEEVSKLAALPFDRAEFAYLFLGAFGNKDVTLKRLRSGSTNASDVPDGVLQRNNINIATCDIGKVDDTLTALRNSPKTAALKAKFIVATDGYMFGAEEVDSNDAPIACEYAKFHDYIGFFLPLAGITTVRQIRESSFDIKATGRLNRLYVELLRDNPDWAKAERRPDMNHFMARLIFCFFAEDTDIFRSTGLFTATVQQFSASDSSNTHEIIANIFRAMNTKPEDHKSAGLPPHADAFPYVNGGLFSGSTDVPRFSKMARSYLLNIGSLDWTKINPDIFGSMIQAVADDDERGALGMHYTSVPNILKVLNPLFLDELRAQLEEAGDNARKLLNLRGRMAKIRVFDPACGSGNFLVIAYKEMRAIEFVINTKRGEPDRRTDLPLTNYRGIELRDFPAEIARLALIIAEYQCDVTYRGQKEALAEFLPLDAQNWITCGNALRLDWLSICPPTGTGVKVQADDLFGTPLDQAEIDFENEGGETYICGNPPYVGATTKAPKGASKETRERLKREDESRKSDLKAIFGHRTKTWKSLDYVSGWFAKAADYGTKTPTVFAFVSTNSICQGQQVPTLWPLIFETGHQIAFAYPSFDWANLAAKNAAVTVVIVGMSRQHRNKSRIYSSDPNGDVTVKTVELINAYLVPGESIIIDKRFSPFGDLTNMTKGNSPTDGGGLILNRDEIDGLNLSDEHRENVVRRFLGSEDTIHGKSRFCLWLNSESVIAVSYSSAVLNRLSDVQAMRLDSDKPQTVALAETPFRFGEVRQTGDEIPLVIPRHSSENRRYLPIILGLRGDIVADSASALYNAPYWNVAIFSSRLHLIWIATVCGKIKSDYRYSNTLGWNTFPFPKLTEQNKADLTRCAENILLAREAHFPATIADLYDPDAMPDNLRRAHDANDALLESIYIGRRFKNDTERLEKLFQLYTKMTASDVGKVQKVGKKGPRA